MIKDSKVSNYFILNGGERQILIFCNKLCKQKKYELKRGLKLSWTLWFEYN